MTPREEGVQGQSPAIRRALREMAGGLCACAQTPALRGECRCARRSARRKRCAGSVTPAHPAEAPGPTRAEPGPGVRYASHPDGRNVPGWVAQAEGSRWPTTLRGPAATEHLRGDRHGPTGFARLAKSHRRSRRKALQRLPGCATAGARPAAAFGGGLERGRRLAPTRAPPLWSERSERNRRGAQPRGWEGVGPQAVGCGLLLGSRGHPIPFAVTAQQAPCGRCIGRPAGAKRKRASPCGLALFEVLTLSRRTPSVASIYYHNLPLLSRAAVRFFGC